MRANRLTPHAGGAAAAGAGAGRRRSGRVVVIMTTTSLERREKSASSTRKVRRRRSEPDTRSHRKHSMYSTYSKDMAARQSLTCRARHVCGGGCLRRNHLHRQMGPTSGTRHDQRTLPHRTCISAVCGLLRCIGGPSGHPWHPGHVCRDPSRAPAGVGFACAPPLFTSFASLPGFPPDRRHSSPTCDRVVSCLTPSPRSRTIETRRERRREREEGKKREGGKKEREGKKKEEGKKKKRENKKKIGKKIINKRKHKK